MEPLTFQTVVNGLLIAVSALLGWFMRSMRDSIQQLHASDALLQDRDRELARDMAAIRELVAGDYVRRDAQDEFGRQIFSKLEQMRLESKQDLKEAVVELKGELARKVDK